jgi:hypothetical protein
VILDLLASGATNLTNVRRLAGKLTPDNHEAILARAVHKTREEIEVLLRELDPRPDLRSSVRKFATPAAAGSPTAVPLAAASQAEIAVPPADSAPSAHIPQPAPRPVVRPSAPERYHVKFTIGEEAHRRLRRVQTLLRREIPDGDPGVIFDRALAALLEKVEKAKRGATSTPRSGGSIRSGTDNPAAPPSRHIPSAVKRAVSKRDADQCAFVSPGGRRCTQRAFLEFHHVQPFAKRGPATVENISLRCRRHNQYEAELVFGSHGASMVGELRATYAAHRVAKDPRESDHALHQAPQPRPQTFAVGVLESETAKRRLSVQPLECPTAL